MIKRYFKLWWMMTVAYSQIAFVSRFGAILFIIGKLLRFASFTLFLFLLLSQTKTLAGYSLWQVMLFFLTFTILDISAQAILREVYRFREYVVSGDFDYILLKPISALFRSLFGGSDSLDLLQLFIAAMFLFYAIGQLDTISYMGIFTYILLFLNGLLIALSFHIVVLGMAILTTEVDNAIMLYRDIVQMGRVPIEVYQQPLRGFLTFILPIGIMIAFPAKALMGLLSIENICIALFVGVCAFFISLQFWKYALKRYSSASS